MFHCAQFSSTGISFENSEVWNLHYYSCECIQYAHKFALMIFRCDEDKDECLDEPCQNGATCEQDLDIPGKYTCFCSDDFVGVHCEEIKIKTCEIDPCKNGATCSDDPGM